MPLQLKTQDELIQDLIASWSAGVGVDPNIPSGDPLKAFMEAAATQLIYLQGKIEEVYRFARASTCKGADLDSWCAQFNFYRDPAQFATGLATFGVKSVKTSNVTIPVGAIIQTPGGAIQYQVIADPAVPAYNSTLDGYVLTAGASSVDVRVQALVAGTSYNLASPNLLTQFVSTVTGIDTVTNNAAIINGEEAQSDEDFLAGFWLYLASFAKATEDAIISCIKGVRQDLSFSLLENVDISNNPLRGNFITVLDDGSGAPSSDLITTTEKAIDKVRAYTVSQRVIAPEKLTPALQLNIRIDPNSPLTQAQVKQNVIDALVNYVNSRKIGDVVYLYRLVQIACDVQYVLSVEPNSVAINATQADLVLTYKQVAKITGDDVSIGTY